MCADGSPCAASCSTDTSDDSVDFAAFEAALSRAASRDAKKRKRALIKKQAAALTPDYRVAADAGIAAALLGSEAFRRAARIFCYVSVKGEPDTAPIIEAALAAGKKVAVPRVLGHGLMEAVYISGPADLTEKDRFGIPAPAAGLPAGAPAEFDLLIIPCVACTKGRARLGHGMGYYDRFMEKAAGRTVESAGEAPAAESAGEAPAASLRTVVLCYEQLLQERLPEEPHDRRPDAVLSEKQWY